MLKAKPLTFQADEKSSFSAEQYHVANVRLFPLITVQYRVFKSILAVSLPLQFVSTEPSPMLVNSLILWTKGCRNAKSTLTK